MPRPTRVVLVLFALLTAAAVCVGRQGQHPEKPAQPSSTTELMQGKVVVHEPATAYRKIGHAELGYFAGKDVTEVRVELDTVYRGRGGSAAMYALYHVEGRKVIRPEEVELGIYYDGDEAGAEGLDGLYFEADGKRIDLDRLKDGGVVYRASEKVYSREVVGQMSFPQFERFAGGKRVTVHAGAAVFELRAKQRAGLRDLLRAIGTVVARP